MVGCGNCQNCINEVWRKALTLCFWGIADCSSHLDEFGERANGIVNYLKQKGINSIKLNNNIAVDAEGRLYIYSEPNDACGYLNAYYEAWKKLPYYKRDFGVIAAQLVNLPPKYFAIFVRRLASNFTVVPIVRKLLSEEPLKLEEIAKKELAANARARAEAAMFALLARIASYLDDEQLEKLVKLWIEEGLLGMALSILHEVAIISSMNINTLTPSNYEQALELADPRAENKLQRLMYFVAEYLKAARELSDYMSDDDYANIRVHIKGAKAYMRLGVHHAEAWVSGSNIVLKYADHNSERAMAFAEFCRRQGWRASVDGNTVEVTVPIEESEKLAKAVAATTSVDIQDLIWIFRDARNVEELLRLRMSG